MNDKSKPPTIGGAVASTVMGLFALASCLLMMRTGASAFVAFAVILIHMGAIAVAVFQWVFYFRAYVDFRIEELRRD